ncbi:MAG: ABC transporter substrate-binding protein [Bacteroidota bacterium]
MQNFRNFSLLLLLASGLWVLFRKDKDVSAGPEKVLEGVIVGHVESMDPIHAHDVVACNEVAKVYEGLVAYHYLKRPYELVPNLAEEMPTVSADGLVYTFKIRQDVRFHDDPCFPDGQGRELTAADFV